METIAGAMHWFVRQQQRSSGLCMKLDYLVTVERTNNEMEKKNDREKKKEKNCLVKGTERRRNDEIIYR